MDSSEAVTEERDDSELSTSGAPLLELSLFAADLLFSRLLEELEFESWLWWRI